MDRQQKIDVLQKEISRKFRTKTLRDAFGNIPGTDYKEEFPVILSDVLMWLENNKIEVDIDGKGLFEIYSGIDEAFERDLTKPYLSEQSDEVINGLYEVFLLTKKD